jgi:hypothetical protein
VLKHSIPFPFCVEENMLNRDYGIEVIIAECSL